ncbi:MULTISPECIES: Nif11-like leader peptide family natural product precursor [unclassified Synechococcus]|uniref:Nif11-like leader peptide family natural product precursor n=1 Tax=unclassified Synechococcus TaxID=2626047 RepID=UPI0009413A4A|nr:MULTISPECIES: Nif11-like leader peptide family natural product precursor [unclassified Synechococcus]
MEDSRNPCPKNLKAFIEKVKGDTRLREKLEAEGAEPVAIAKDAGFMISIDDLKKAQSEISEEELEGVAGGMCLPYTQIKGCQSGGMVGGNPNPGF